MTIQELVSCADRELMLRRRLYPSFITRGKLTKEKAQHELDCMSAIVENLKAQKPVEPDLFAAMTKHNP